MIAAVLGVAAALATPPAVEDPLPPLDAETAQRAVALERGHLVRLGVFAGASAVAGGVLLATSGKDPRLRHYGIQSVAWAGVDLAIVGAAWKGAALPPTRAELARTRELYQLNVGLDVGYVGTGAALGLLGHLDQRDAIEGAGWGIATQGLGLLVLDAIVLAKLPRAVR